MDDSSEWNFIIWDSLWMMTSRPSNSKRVSGSFLFFLSYITHTFSDSLFSFSFRVTITFSNKQKKKIRKKNNLFLCLFFYSFVVSCATAGRFWCVPQPITPPSLDHFFIMSLSILSLSLSQFLSFSLVLLILGTKDVFSNTPNLRWEKTKMNFLFINLYIKIFFNNSILFWLRILASETKPISFTGKKKNNNL